MMEIVCQVVNEEDIATLGAVWEEYGLRCTTDWMAGRHWGAAVVELIPPGKFEPTHNYGVGTANGAVFIVDQGIAPMFAGLSEE